MKLSTIIRRITSRQPAWMQKRPVLAEKTPLSPEISEPDWEVVLAKRARFLRMDSIGQ